MIIDQICICMMITLDVHPHSVLFWIEWLKVKFNFSLLVYCIVSLFQFEFLKDSHGCSAHLYLLSFWGQFQSATFSNHVELWLIGALKVCKVHVISQFGPDRMDMDWKFKSGSQSAQNFKFGFFVWSRPQKIPLRIRNL